MKFGSLFTGVGGFDLGFERAGMTCAWQCEIDKSANDVLAHHWPEVKRYEDVREIGKRNLEPVQLICGGFPCQDLSIAGKREGLAGSRSGLWWEFARIIDELEPKWVVAENVAGLLSSNKGRDFALILRWLVERGYGVSWRIFDSQYFGVPQRRRRVFIVGSFGNGRSAEVLFEREGMFGNIAEIRKAREGTAETFTIRTGKDGGGKGYLEASSLVAYSIREDAQANNFSATEIDKSNALNSLQPSPQSHHAQTFLAFQRSQLRTQGKLDQLNIAPTLKSETKNGDTELNVWQMNNASEAYRECGDKSPTLQERMGTGGNNVPLVGVRRLTPKECERLQGFPDDWTAICSDTQRYKQMGNAVTVNVIEWIGKRIMEAK